MLTEPEAPGIYLMPKNAHLDSSWNKFKHFSVKQVGHLSTSATKNEWVLYFDGILIESPDEFSDAEFTLNTFLSGGISEVQKLEGFFNTLVINKETDEAHLTSDLLCSRPWYLYKKENQFALSPSSLAFAHSELEMNLSRQALYEQVRLLHTGYDRTLMQEVKRILPGFVYTFNKECILHKKSVFKFTQNKNPDLDLEQSADAVKKICSNVIKGVSNHEKLKKLPVHLPLTGGLDSRHLLGELIEQGKTPDLLQHINIKESDYDPVKKIAQALDIPLQVTEFDELEFKDLIKRWMVRSGGLVNIHQFYLIQIKNHQRCSPALSFNGYLLDQLVGLAIKTNNLNKEQSHKVAWNRTYSSPSIRTLLIPNEKRWESETEKLFIDEINLYKGESWFKALMMDLHHRALHYTGVIDWMVSQEVHSFSPGASIQAYKFVSQANHKIAGDKRARLRALQKYFPKLASFPGTEKKAFSELDVRPEILEDSFRKSLSLFLESVKSKLKIENNFKSEHSWIRNNNDLHKMHKNFIHDSELVKDGYIFKRGLKASWYINELGGYQGWTLMSLLSVEIAYRLLTKKQSLDTVLDWLNQDI